MPNYRDVIDRNLVVLCELTRCNQIFIDKCAERNVVTWADRDEIQAEKTPYKRNSTFYTIMRLKDALNFRMLGQIMKEQNTAQSGDVLNIFEHIQCEQTGQKCLRFQNPVEAEEKCVWFNVRDPVTSFVGRENELKKLHEMVTRNVEKDTQIAVMSQLTSVSGLGGIGKTTVAREYAKRYASFFNNNIIWINAETASSTEESFRKLADKIGFQNKVLGKQNVEEVQISKVISDTYEYLSRRKCLFVFDNVEEYKSTVSPFIPKSYEPGKIRPYILMTSRKQRLVDDCKVLRLDTLAIDEAEEFIKSKLQQCVREIDDETVRQLAIELQCLPLALQQAVAYIRKQVRLKSFFLETEKDNIKEYLKLLEENPKVALSHMYQDETMDDYAYTVMRTWDVTLIAIEREEYGRQAIEILGMLSYYPPENIDFKQFEFAFPEEELYQSFDILEQYSLINRTMECINIHRLVQQVVRVQSKEKNREEYLLERCLSLSVRKKISARHKSIYWNIWKRTLQYENLVIKLQFTLTEFLGIYKLIAIGDIEVLSSILELLEKSVTQSELMDLYVIFIRFSLDELQIFSRETPDWLAQQVMCRMNAILELGHYDTVFKILSSVSSTLDIYNKIPISRVVRDVLQVISHFCYARSEEICQKQDDTPYCLIRLWLKYKEPGECRICFKLLVLRTGADSVNKTVIQEKTHPVFKNFYLFDKRFLQPGIVADKNEREFMVELLDFCRCLTLDLEGIKIMEKVDVLVCNILCLVLLNYKSVHEILVCVFKISVHIRKELTEFPEYERQLVWLHSQVDFHLRRRTLTGAIRTFKRLVNMVTTPPVSSEWVQYVNNIIKLIGTFQKIVDVEHPDQDYFASCLPELESTISELENSCRPIINFGEKASPGNSSAI